MLLKKLEEKAVRYEEVNELVQDPDLIRDQKKYKDVLIYKNGYKLSKLDRQFMTELCAAKRKYK